jgi:hypothetical protein
VTGGLVGVCHRFEYLEARQDAIVSESNYVEMLASDNVANGDIVDMAKEAKRISTTYSAAMDISSSLNTRYIRGTAIDKVVICWLMNDEYYKTFAMMLRFAYILLRNEAVMAQKSPAGAST